MFTTVHRLHITHRSLLQRYPLVLASLLACSVLAARIYLSHSWAYGHLVWNLFLAWVPYLCSMWAASIYRPYPGGAWRLILPGMLWLIFFPNAPYLVTEFVHLRQIAPLALWYDVGLLSTFAWTGCFLAVASLHIMQTLAKTFVGHTGSWLFVIGVAGLSGLGIYLGRFLRWNSWDLFLDPRGILVDVGSSMAHPGQRPRMFGVTFMFAAFLLVCYVAFATARAES